MLLTTYTRLVHLSFSGTLHLGLKIFNTQKRETRFFNILVLVHFCNDTQPLLQPSQTIDYRQTVPRHQKQTNQAWGGL